MHCKAFRPEMVAPPPPPIDHAVPSALSLLSLACILTLPPPTLDDVPSFKKTSKHLILDSIFFITTMLMMGCCASNQVRKLLQTDHIWNFTIAVLPFAVAILSQPRRGLAQSGHYSPSDRFLVLGRETMSSMCQIFLFCKTYEMKW